MDVYLEPLIEEIQELWNGVAVMDVTRPLDDRCAIVKGILLWTMHDYPGLGEISGTHMHDSHVLTFNFLTL